MSEHTTHDDSPSPTLYDVIIIGAGPCGLAVAARMCEHTPSALFTDDEHQRYHWIRKHGRKMSIMKGKNGCVVLPRTASSKTKGDNKSSGNSHRAPYKTLVLDASGDQWMANWNRLFKAFDITHLRSPMFFHVDPRDRDGLLSFTYEQDRKGELREIGNCVGRETSKYRKKKQLARMAKEGTKGPQARLEIDERDRKDYYAPSSSLFHKHCECIVDRYGLKEGLIKHDRVQDIDFGIQESVSETDEIFTLKTDQNVYYSRSVVVAVGAGNAPSIPCHDLCNRAQEGVCHSNQIKEFPPPNVARKIKCGRSTNILVIGGGLTSAQLDDLAVRKGVSKVCHIMRTDLKVKPFDVSLEWMGKFRNHEKATFWSADSDEGIIPDILFHKSFIICSSLTPRHVERLQHIREARNGGSITPFYEKILRSHIATGRVSLHTNTHLATYEYNAASGTFAITTEPPIPELPEIDYVYFATGVTSDFATLPFFRTMLKKYPLHGHGGFPCLSEDLMWRGSVAGALTDLHRDNKSKVDGASATKSRRKSSVEQSNDKANDAEGIDGCNNIDKRIPLFITGKLASLRLGPGAGNLEGARIGAERITWALQEVLDEPFNDVRPDIALASSKPDSDCSNDGDYQSNEESFYRYCAGIGSRFESLEIEKDDDIV